MLQSSTRRDQEIKPRFQLICLIFLYLAFSLNHTGEIWNLLVLKCRYNLSRRNKKQFNRSAIIKLIFACFDFASGKKCFKFEFNHYRGNILRGTLCAVAINCSLQLLFRELDRKRRTHILAGYIKSFAWSERKESKIGIHASEAWGLFFTISKRNIGYR